MCKLKTVIGLTSCPGRTYLGWESKLCSCQITCTETHLILLVRSKLFQVQVFLFFRANCQTHWASCMDDFASSCTTKLLLYFATRLYLLHLFLIWVYASLVIFLIFPFLPSQPYLLFLLFPFSYLPSFSTFFMLKPWLILVRFGLFFWIWTWTFWFIAFHSD